MTATVLAVCAASEDVELTTGPSGINKRPTHGPVQVGVLGLETDHVCDTAHHGGVDQAVYIYDDAEAARWAHELQRDLPYGWFGENLRTTGIAVTDALVGERWRIGDTLVIEATIPRTPCKTFAAWADDPTWIKRFTQRADTGAYFRVLTPGPVQSGAPITVEHRPTHGVTVRDLFTGTDAQSLRQLLAVPNLAAKVDRDAHRKLRLAQRMESS